MWKVGILHSCLLTKTFEGKEKNIENHFENTSICEIQNLFISSLSINISRIYFSCRKCFLFEKLRENKTNYFKIWKPRTWVFHTFTMNESAVVSSSLFYTVLLAKSSYLRKLIVPSPMILHPLVLCLFWISCSMSRCAWSAKMIL